MRHLLWWFPRCFYILGNIVGKALQSFFADLLELGSFVLLLFISFKMFYEFFKGEEGAVEINNKALLVIAVSTSIDAAVAGVAFSHLVDGFIFVGLIVGIISFLFTIFAFFLTKKLKKVEIIERYSLLIGALILAYLAMNVI